MKKLTVYVRSLLTAGAFLFLTTAVQAQSYADSLAQDDKDILSSIAPYPADVREAILGVSQYPQALVKIERIQARSSQAFQDMVEGYSRAEQEKLYEASRFPELVRQLTSRGRLADSEVTPLLKDMPSATQTRLRETYASHYDDLVKMNSLYQTSQDGLDKIIGGYPTDVQDNFKKVVSMPDVVNLLTDNINLTVSLGEEFRADPNGVRQELDRVSGQLSDENAKDLAAYKQQVESDPEMQKEMKSAATDFSSAYDQPDNPTYVTNNYYDNYPYPYWTSYPYWYSTPIWYPRPVYYHTGYYYGPGGGLIIVGLPSRTYSTWFFGRGYRHYPHLYRNYNSYYTIHHANINNVNVYRGFNNTANRHFNSRGTRGRSDGYRNSTPRPTNVNPGRNAAPTRSSRLNNTATRTTRNGQMNVAPNNFNNRGIQQFHATDYHRSGWQQVSGARTGGTMTRPSSAPTRMGTSVAPRTNSAPRSSGNATRGSTGGARSAGGRGRH